ncbi:MAG TPA: hypothetical protein VK614_00825 [Allosphingosinicella sp.]|nr:hypothetical protein [Allosphingosinicella sp.]
MSTQSDVQLADRLSRRRARMLPILGILFLAGQPLYFTNSNPASVPNQMKISAWLVWAVALLVALAFAGGRFHGAKVRALMEDESTLANRMRAYAAGFWAAAISAVGLYAVTLFDEVKGREAIHIILAFSVAVAVIRFGTLERRALKDG